jgi:hypothetical protein
LTDVLRFFITQGMFSEGVTVNAFWSDTTAMVLAFLQISTGPTVALFALLSLTCVCFQQDNLRGADITSSTVAGSLETIGANTTANNVRGGHSIHTSSSGQFDCCPFLCINRNNHTKRLRHNLSAWFSFARTQWSSTSQLCMSAGLCGVTEYEFVMCVSQRRLATALTTPTAPSPRAAAAAPKSLTCLSHKKREFTRIPRQLCNRIPR